MRSKLTAAVVVILAVVVTASTLYAGVNINVDYVRKPVVFLYAPDSAGVLQPLGTGFLVQILARSKPEQSYKLLVTARHIVDPAWAHCPAPYPSKIFMRINKKTFDAAKDPIGTVDVPLPFTADGHPVFATSTDDEADVAVIVVTGLLNQNEEALTSPQVGCIALPVHPLPR
jgi:hypothetical protein